MVASKRSFKNITADFHEFANVGDSVEGTLLQKDSITFTRAGQVNDVGKYTLVTDEGERISFLGGTVIDQTLQDVEVGSYVRITFKGTRKTGNNMDMKDYDIELAE